MAHTDGLNSTSSSVFRIFHQLPGSTQRHSSNKVTFHTGTWAFWFQLTQQSYIKKVIIGGKKIYRSMMICLRPFNSRETSSPSKLHTAQLPQWWAAGKKTSFMALLPLSFLVLGSLNSCQQLLTPPNEVVPQNLTHQSRFAMLIIIIIK